MAHDKYFISGKRSVTVAIFLPSNLNIAQIGNSRELFFCIPNGCTILGLSQSQSMVFLFIRCLWQKGKQITLSSQ
jgi:hypothetical protein